MQLQPVRNGVIKRYFDKFKYRKLDRDALMELVAETDEPFAKILGEEYLHFTDAFPETKDFIKVM